MKKEEIHKDIREMLNLLNIFFTNKDGGVSA